LKKPGGIYPAAKQKKKNYPRGKEKPVLTNLQVRGKYGSGKRRFYGEKKEFWFSKKKNYLKKQRL